jgi:hypothetical protein
VRTARHQNFTAPPREAQVLHSSVTRARGQQPPTPMPIGPIEALRPQESTLIGSLVAEEPLVMPPSPGSEGSPGTDGAVGVVIGVVEAWPFVPLRVGRDPGFPGGAEVDGCVPGAGVRVVVPGSDGPVVAPGRWLVDGPGVPGALLEHGVVHGCGPSVSARAGSRQLHPSWARNARDRCCAWPSSCSVARARWCRLPAGMRATICLIAAIWPGVHEVIAVSAPALRLRTA